MDAPKIIPSAIVFHQQLGVGKVLEITETGDYKISFLFYASIFTIKKDGVELVIPSYRTKSIVNYQCIKDSSYQGIERYEMLERVRNHVLTRNFQSSI